MLGLELGSNYYRLAAVRAARRLWPLLGSQHYESAVPGQDELATRLLSSVRSERKKLPICQRRMVVCLIGTDVLTHQQPVPAEFAERDITALIELACPDWFMVPRSRVLLDYLVIRQAGRAENGRADKGQAENILQLFACRQDVLQERLAPLRKINCLPHVIDVEPVALLRAARVAQWPVNADGQTFGDRMLLLKVSVSSLSLHIWRAEALEFTRTFPYSMPVAGDGRESLARLGLEVRRALQVWGGRLQTDHADRVFISGDLAYINGLRALLESYGLVCSFSEQPSFALAMGAAMRHGSGGSWINKGAENHAAVSSCKTGWRLWK